METKRLCTSRISILVYSVLCISILLNSQMTHGTTVVIEDTFENDTNWSFISYDMDWNNTAAGFLHNKASVTGVAVDNGILQFNDPNVEDLAVDYGSEALTNITTLYGEWSFDFNPDPVYSDFAVAFAHTYIDSLDGRVDVDIRMSGYSVIVSTTDEVNPLRGPGLHLARFKGDTAGFENLESKLLGSNIAGWNSLKIIRALDGQINVSLNDEVLISYDDTNTVDSAIGVSIMNWQGSTQVDNFKVVDYQVINETGVISTPVITDTLTTEGGISDSNTGDIPWNVLPVISGVIASGMVLRLVWTRYAKKKLRNLFLKFRVRQAQSTLKVFSDIFTPAQLSYLAVLGQQKVEDSQISNKVGKPVPSNFKDFKFLMHPNRLSIMKILHRNFSMPSHHIKNQLDISWGEYTNHITSLEQRGYVTVTSEFVNETHTKIVYLEEAGRRDFEALILIIHDFLDDVTYNFFENKPPASLYPISEE